MKASLRLLSIGIISVGVLSFLLFQSAHAQATLSEEQKQRIVTNCQAIKSSLNQLHASDALLRVNRGQIYESMSAKLMNNFNTRLSNNNQDNKGLVVLTNGYQSALTTFRNDYQSYERQLAATINVDCSKEPVAFHDSLEDARAKRLKLHTDVVRLHTYIDDYRSAVNDFLLNYQRQNGGN